MERNIVSNTTNKLNILQISNNKISKNKIQRQALKVLLINDIYKDLVKSISFDMIGTIRKDIINRYNK